MKAEVSTRQKAQTSDSAIEKLIAVCRKEFGSEWVGAFKRTVKLDFQYLSL